MKLLFDQNLPRSLVALCADAFADSRHLKDFDLTEADDEAIWTFARKNGFAIVSKDSDFMHRALLRGSPPKVIFVRLGNCPTRRVADRLLAEIETIHHFDADAEEALLVIE